MSATPRTLFLPGFPSDERCFCGIVIIPTQRIGVWLCNGVISARISPVVAEKSRCVCCGGAFPPGLCSNGARV